MKRIFLLAVLLGTTSCSSALSQPFQDLKSQPITIYRLQNFEPQPQQGAAVGGVQLPPQIQQWVTAGAAMLPPGLIPPGLLPGGTPAATATDAPRFHNFRILGSVAVTDPKQREQILDLFGNGSNFSVPRQQCMYAEFGFQIGQPAAAGTPVGMPSTSPPADILVSLSCDQVQMINYNWPYGAKNALGPSSAEKVRALVVKAFGG